MNFVSMGWNIPLCDEAEMKMRSKLKSTDKYRKCFTYQMSVSMFFCFHLDPFQCDYLFLGWHFRRKMKWLQEMMWKVKMGENCKSKISHERKCSLTVLHSMYFLEKLDTHISAKFVSLNVVDMSSYTTKYCNRKCGTS